MEKAWVSITRQPTLILLLIFLAGVLLYFPSLLNFYSHDDFFHLKISQANSINDFINFFNLLSAPDGFGFYRPLTTQFFYFISIKFFNLNPLPLHVISFGVYFLVIYLVYKLSYEIIPNTKIALVASFLYAVSATHFGHLYYLGAFQELGLAAFFFTSAYCFINYLKRGKIKYYLLSLGTFVGALLSKESAVVIPATLLILYVFFIKTKAINLKHISFLLSPFVSILVIYLYLHFFHYGQAQGDSYIWDFSGRVFNTAFWYLLWSFNLPEMLVDYVGSGLKIQPNLMKFYGRETIIQLVLFCLMIAALVLKPRSSFDSIYKEYKIYLLSISWFIVALLPVLFLPWHKYAYELTVPIFGVVLALGNFFKSTGKVQLGLFLALFLFLSIVTLNLTSKTHWITQGGKVAKSAMEYMDISHPIFLSRNIVINFYDVPEDFELPWLPSNQLKLILSDQNFFDVFYYDKFIVLYGSIESKTVVKGNIVEIKARDLLDY